MSSVTAAAPAEPMRILHTGDWHLNHRIDRVHFNGYLHDAIEQITDCCRAESIDVLLVAGDLFAGREGREQLKESVGFLRKTFGPLLKDGLTMLAISGNHDSEAFFETLRDAFDLAAPSAPNEDGIHPSGRLYVAPNPTVRTLRGRGGQIAQFILMPFPTPRAYIEGERVNYRNVEERNRNVAQTYRERLEHLLRERVKPEFPSVLVAHAVIRGVSENDFFQASDANDVVLETTDLPPQVAYGAFGHIHRAQEAIAGGSRFWYCGSLVPLDAGEAGHDKGALLVEIGQTGLIAPPRPLPLRCPRLLDLTITAPEIDGLEAKYADHNSAVVKYRLRYRPSEHPDPYPLHQRIRAVFPNWYDGGNEAAPEEDRPKPGSGETQDLKDVRGTVAAYLESVSFADADLKREVVDLAETLLSDASYVADLRRAR